MKKMLPFILIILFPYFIVLLICSLFNEFLMKYICHNNFYLGLFYLFAFWLVAFISAMILCVKNFVNKTDAVEITRINMVIKIVQVPAYLCIFVVGFVCLLTIFMLGFSFALVVFDCAAIILSGLIGVSAVSRSYAEGMLSQTEMVIHSILQFIFCLDVISSIIVFRKIKVASIAKKSWQWQPEYFHCVKNNQIKTI